MRMPRGSVLTCRISLDGSLAADVHYTGKPP
jgi:hypothetical protein